MYTDGMLVDPTVGVCETIRCARAKITATVTLMLIIQRDV